MASQVEIEAQINKLLTERTAILRQNATEISAQVEMAANLCAAMACENVDQVRESMAELNQELVSNREKIKDTEQGIGDMNAEMKKSEKSSRTFKGAMVGAFVGLKNGAQSAWIGVKSLFGSIVDFGKSVWNIGKSIMGAWNTMTGFLIDKAIQGGSANKAIQNAWEDVRDTFGAFENDASTGVKQAFGELTSGADGLAAGGLNVAKTFGVGPDGMAAAIAATSEIAQGLGREFYALDKGAFKDIIGSAFRLTKGMGMSGEGLAQMSRNARSAGMSVKDAYKETERMGAYMEKKFGISAKAVGKNFDEMVQNVEVFGDMTRREMMGAAAWATKLGVEIKSLQGLTSKTDDFEGAANAVSKLSEAFGMQVDTMALMTADPAEKAEMIQKAFQATGKDFSTMNRQQKAYMAELTGMGVGDLQGLMSPEAMGMDEFMDAANEGADGAITQAEASKQLSKSIKQLNETMGGMNSTKGFFATFLEGASKGFTKSKMFKELLQKVRDSLRMVFQTGKKVGAMLAELFEDTGPFGGMRKIFDEYFSPAKWKARMEGVQAAFRTFVDMMKTDPQKALAGLMGDLKKVFFDGSGGEFFKTIKAGLVKGVDFLGAALIGAIPKLLSFVIEGFQILIAMLSGKGLGDEMGQGVMFPMLMNAWAGVKDQIGPMVTQIWDLFKTLLSTFWDKYGQEATIFLGGLLAAFIGKAVLAALAGAGIGAIVGKALGPIMDGLKSMLGMGGSEGSAVENVAKNVTKGVTAGVNEMQSMSLAGLAKAGLIAAAMAYFIMEGLVPMAKEVVKAAKVFMSSGVSFEAVAMAIGSLVGVTYSIKQISEAAKNIGAGDMMKTGVAMAAMVLLIPHLADLGIEIAHKIAGAGLDKLNWMDVLKFFAVIAPLVGTAVAMVWAATKLDPASVVTAGLGLAAMVMLIPHLSELGVGIARDIMGAGLEKLEWSHMAKFFVGLEGMVLTSVGMVYAASLLQPPSLLAAGLGLAAMVLLIPHLADLGVEIINKIASVLSQLNSISYENLGKFMLAIAGMATIAAGLVVASVAVAASLNPVTALIAVAALGAMILMVPHLADLGILLVKRLAQTNAAIVEKGGNAGIIIAKVAGSMAVAFISLVGVGFGALIGGGAAANKGLNTLADLGATIVEQLLPVIQKINNTVPGDPKKIGAKVDVILKLVTAMFPLADIATSLGKVAGKNPNKAIKVAQETTKVIDKVLWATKDLLNTIIRHLKGLSETDIKKAAAFGPLLGSMAKMMESVTPDLNAFKDTMEKTNNDVSTGFGFISKDMTSKTKTVSGATQSDVRAWGTAIKGALGSLGTALTSVFEAVKELDVVEEGSPLLNKLETAGKLSEILSNIAVIVGSTIASGDPAKFHGQLGRLGDMFYGADGIDGRMDLYDLSKKFSEISWPSVSDSTIEALAGTKRLYHAIGGLTKKYGPIDELWEGVTYWQNVDAGDFKRYIDNVIAIGSYITTTGGKELTDAFVWDDAVNLADQDFMWRGRFWNPITGILSDAQEFSKKFGGNIASGFISDIEKVVSAWNDLNQILEGSNYLFDTTIALEQFADTLGIEKPDITISRGDVNINLALSVKMEANQVAEILVEKTQLVKAGPMFGQ